MTKIQQSFISLIFKTLTYRIKQQINLINQFNIIQSHNHQNSKDSVIVNKFSDLH